MRADAGGAKRQTPLRKAYDRFCALSEAAGTLVSEYRKLPELSRKFPKSSRKR
jgi:hypothetical protein